MLNKNCSIFIKMDKKYFMTIISSVLLFSSQSTHVQASPLPMNIRVLPQEIVETARNARAANPLTALDAKKNPAAEVQAAEKLWGEAQDVTSGGDLTTTLRNFLELKCQVFNAAPVCVTRPKTGVRRSVFSDETSQIVVKVIPRTMPLEIIREISGQAALAPLNVGIVDYLALGKCTIDGTDFFLLAMRKAPGVVIRHYVDAIFTASDRVAATEKCKNLLFRIGQTLAKLHSQKAVSANPDPTYIQALMKSRKEEIASNLEPFKKANHPDLPRLESLFENLLKSYETSYLYFAQFHGDAHLENFLYDKDSDALTPIDIGRSHNSVDPLNNPISPNYLHDLSQFETDISKRVLQNEVNEELVKELQSALITGYNAQQNPLFIPSHYLLDRAATLLSRWRGTLGWEKEKDPVKKVHMERLYAHFRNALNKDT